MHNLQQIKLIVENILNNFILSSENILYLLILLLLGTIGLTLHKHFELNIHIITSYCIISFIFLYALNNLNFLHYIDKGISRANFFGYSSKIKMYSIIIYLIFSTLIFFIYLVWLKKNKLQNINFTSLQSKENLYKKYKDLFLIIFIFIGYLFIMPDLLAFKPQWTSWAANPNNWDVQNLLTWDELYISGLVPMKDFWYPYGNLIFTEAFPVSGRLLLWVLQCGYITLSSILLLNLNKDKKYLIIFINILICIYLLQNDFWGIIRYGTPTAAIGLLIYYFLNNKYKQKFYIVIQFFLTLTPWLGGSIVALQFILLSISIGLLGLFKLSNKKEFDIKNIFNKNTIPYFSSFILYILYSVFKGTFLGELRDVINSRQMLEKSSYPMDFINTFIEKPILSILVFLIIPIILSIAIFSTLNLYEDNFQFGVIMLIFGISYTFSLYKWASRGDLNDLRSIVILQTLIFAQFAINKIGVKKHETFLFFLIFTVFSILTTNIDITKRFEILNKNLSSDTFYTIYNERIELKKRQLAYRNFNEVADLEILNNYLLENKLLPFYSPTDLGYLNSLNLQKPYYFISSYDSSTLSANEKILQLLKKKEPKSIIIDKKSLYFDSIHVTIRLPIVMQWIVNNYDFKDEIGNYIIFIQKNYETNFSIEKWNSVFGKIDFGNIPYLIEEDNCTQKECIPYIKIKLRKESDFCYVSFRHNSQIVEYFFPINYQKEYAIFPMAKTWSFNELTEIDKISCADSYQILKVNSNDRFF